MEQLVGVEAVRAAQASLRGVIETTPVEHSRAIGDLVGGDVRLKCENLQRTGSFKLRGAHHRIARLSDDERRRGVVCASAGNHAQGVALAAKLQGVRATVFMPREAPLPKVDATQGYGAEVRLEGDTFDEALATALEHAQETGSVFVHPFDHPDIIAGQGTLGLELLEQVPDLGTVVVCVGGGGLLAGVAVALRALRPDVRIIGVQAAGSASFPASMAAGEAIASPTCDTIADGIAVKRPGELTLAHARQLVDEVVAVDDEEIARAVVLLLERAKLVVEPAGAAGVAALLSGRVEVDASSPTVVTLSGGNIDPLMLQHLVTGGLTTEGRYVTLRTQVPDTPGQLSRLLRLLGDQRANVVGVSHHRLEHRLRLGQVEVVLELETRGHDHVAALRSALEGEGYPLHRA
ncbi:threonine ammonia-lyase [Egicoccus halophilus]|uniref:L-threonine dehydratase catabolic TdcB n=1 Tax=Egicoccus halophilus TaxID=1670830 RepID=A0A8J3EUL0_9ACTN|nr:threonine ammonia-lyase [Egicoccus halophilus]GGI06091.1 threonine ammonia-lyase [Egicoccus halophilus]